MEDAARLLAALIACPALARGYTDAATQALIRDARAWLAGYEDAHPADGDVLPGEIQRNVLIYGDGVTHVEWSDSHDDEPN